MRTLLNYILFFFITFLTSYKASFNPYRVLGVAPYHSMKHIKKVYKDFMIKLHPDKNPDKSEQAKKRFYEIQTAYEHIKDNKVSIDDSSQFENSEGNYNGGFIFNLSWEIISDSGSYCIILNIVYWVSYGVFESVKYLYSFITAIILCYFIIEHVASHLFENTQQQLIGALVLYVLYYALRSISWSKLIYGDTKHQNNTKKKRNSTNNRKGKLLQDENEDIQPETEEITIKKNAEKELINQEELTKNELQEKQDEERKKELIDSIIKRPDTTKNSSDESDN